MENMYLSRIAIIPSSSAKSMSKQKKRNKFWLCRIGNRIRHFVLFHHIIQVERIPVSLGVLTTFYRFFGFSFSGCLLEELNGNYKIDQQTFSLNNWRYSLKRISNRYLSLGIHFIVLFLYFGPFLNVQMRNDFELSVANSTVSIEVANMSGKSNYTHIRFEDFENFLSSIAQGRFAQNDDMAQLKPILRLIVQWLVYVFMFNGFFAFAYNLVFGGSFLSHLVEIQEFAQLDRQKTFARWLIAMCLVVIFSNKLLGIWLFQKKLIVLFLYPDWGNFDPEFNKIKRPAMALHFIGEMFATLMHYVSLSMVSCLFIYAMVLFCKCVEQMQTEVATFGAELDETHMSMLKTRLFRLNESFKRIIRYFSVPIIVDLCANTYYIIGAACFLIINQDLGVSPYAVAFIANIGLFALIRLVVVAAAGNLTTNACHTLIRLVYEAKGEWTLAEWLCFLEIKRAPQEFSVSVFSVFQVSQSSILTMLGFALQYIVILLQTENYGSQGQNDTITSNSTV